MTVLAALHDLNLAARYFPRLVLFSSGVVADGSPAQVLDEGILSRMYETRVQVGILRGEEHLSVLPLGHLAGRSLDLGQQRLVHVVAGGGSGELLMRALADARIDFVAGPLNVGDSDAALAERLATLCILEPPYAPSRSRACTPPGSICGVPVRLSSARYLWAPATSGSWRRPTRPGGRGCRSSSLSLALHWGWIGKWGILPGRRWKYVTIPDRASRRTASWWPRDRSGSAATPSYSSGWLRWSWRPAIDRWWLGAPVAHKSDNKVDSSG